TGSVLFSLGLAPEFTLATDLMVGTAPPERAGEASGISETSFEFGGALGIAVLGSIGTAVYRSQIAGAIPQGVPPPAAATARDTLGGASTVTGQLPGQQGAALLAAGRDAFTSGVQVSAGISAAIAICIAISTVLLLRRVPVSPSQDE
ncbi:MAG TPA: MFS transporter, partial [Candidatus Binatia bacterium]|nr:MFS transporter [Candidatus Binatia bacterium]